MDGLSTGIAAALTLFVIMYSGGDLWYGQRDRSRDPWLPFRPRGEPWSDPLPAAPVEESLRRL